MLPGFPVMVNGTVLIGPNKCVSKKAQDVWRLLAMDMTRFEIAKELGISHKTVEYHMAHLKKQMNMKKYSRIQFYIYAKEAGLV